MSEKTVSQHDILSDVEHLFEEVCDLSYIKQKVKIAFHHLLEHVNCKNDIQELFDKDILTDYIKFAFADELNSTSIDEALKTVPVICASVSDFAKNCESYSARNASFQCFYDQLANVWTNFNLKRYSHILFISLMVRFFALSIDDESVLLSPKAILDEKIEKFTYAWLGLIKCKIIFAFLKSRFSQVHSFSKCVSNILTREFVRWLNCTDFLHFWETRFYQICCFREAQNILNAFVSTIEDRDNFLLLVLDFFALPKAYILKSFTLELDFKFDLEVPSILFILQRTEAATLALDVLKTKTLQSRNQISNTQEVSKTWEMIKEGKEKIRLGEISKQVNQNDEKATVLVYQIDSNGILHCCLLNGDVKLFTFPQAHKKALVSQMQILLKSCDIRLPRSVSFFSHVKEDMNTSNNTSKLDMSHKRYQQDKMTNSSETQCPLQISTSKLKNLNAKWAAKSLYNILVKPLKDSLKGEKLIIIPDQHLFCLPFSGLVDENNNSLSMNFRIQIVPTLHYLLSSLANTVDSESIGPAMFVGNPNLDYISRDGKPLMPPLPHATKEAMQLASLFNVNPIIKNEATKSRVCTNLEQVSIFHVASHAEPTFGWIYLAPDFDFVPAKVIKTYAYMLQKFDFYSLDLRKVRLVFLSCCNTGRGEVTSDGIFGIAREFLSAGARSVIITLWPVDDDITLEFAHIFYTYLCQEKSVCESLQLTMKHFQTSENQYYKMYRSWAPFQVLGEDVRFTKEELGKIRELGTLI